MDCRLQHSSACYYFGFRGNRKWSDSLPQIPLLRDYCFCNDHYGVHLSLSYIVGTKSGLTTPLWHIYSPLPPPASTSFSVYLDLPSIYFPQQTQKNSRERKLLELNWDLKSKTISQTLFSQINKKKTSTIFDFFYNWFFSQGISLMQSPIWKIQVSTFITHCIPAFQVITAFISTPCVRHISAWLIVTIRMNIRDWKA